MTAWVPSWGLISTKHLELRKRRALMLTVVLLCAAFRCSSSACG